jgi:hypothetical protein
LLGGDSANRTDAMAQARAIEWKLDPAAGSIPKPYLPFLRGFSPHPTVSASLLLSTGRDRKTLDPNLSLQVWASVGRQL